MNAYHIPDPITTANELLLTRRAAGVSQATLAQLCGLTPASICRIERGHTAITSATGYHLALVFAWIAREPALAAAPAGQSLLRPHAPGRPAALKGNERPFELARLDNTPLSYTDTRALPATTRYKRRESKGYGVPLQPDDQWILMERMPNGQDLALGIITDNGIAPMPDM